MKIYNFLLTKLSQLKGSIPAIGRKAGIAPTTIHSWVTYGKIPTIDKAEKVLNAMGYEIQIVPLPKEQDK